MKKRLLTIFISTLLLTSCTSYSKTVSLENTDQNYYRKEQITLNKETFTYNKKVVMQLDKDSANSSFTGDVKQTMKVVAKGEIYSKNSDTNYYLDITEISYTMTFTGAGKQELKDKYLNNKTSYASKFKCPEEDFTKFINKGKTLTVTYDSADYDRCYLYLYPDDKENSFNLTGVSFVL